MNSLEMKKSLDISDVKLRRFLTKTRAAHADWSALASPGAR